MNRIAGTYTHTTVRYLHLADPHIQTPLPQHSTPFHTTLDTHINRHRENTLYTHIQIHACMLHMYAQEVERATKPALNVPCVGVGLP